MPRKKKGVLQHAQLRINELINVRVDSNGHVQKLGGHGNDRGHPKKLTASKCMTGKMEDLVIRMLPVFPSSEQALPSESFHHPSTNFSDVNLKVTFGKPSIVGQFFRKNLWSALSTSSTSNQDSLSSSSYSEVANNNPKSLVQSKENITTSFAYKEAKTSPTLFGQSSTVGQSFLKSLPILFGRPSAIGRFVHNHSSNFFNKKIAKPSVPPTDISTPMSVVCREAKTATLRAHELPPQPSAMQLTHQIIMKQAKLTNPEPTTNSGQTPASQDMTKQVQAGHAQNAIILVQARHSQDINASAQLGRSPEINVRVQVEQYPNPIVHKENQPPKHEFPTVMELRLLAKLQNIIEEAMYDFGEKYMPDILLYQGWDCPEAAELTAWIPILSRYKLLPRYALANNARARNLANLLFDVKHLRNAAVHRSLLGLSKIKSSIQIAVSLVELLRDEERVEQLRSIQDILHRSDFRKLRHVLSIDRSGQSLKQQLDNNNMRDGGSRKKRQLEFQAGFHEDNKHIEDYENDAKRRKVDYPGSNPRTISNNNEPKQLRNIVDLTGDPDDVL